MLSFPSQNDKKTFLSKQPGVLEKTDLGDDKPTYSGLIQSYAVYVLLIIWPFH